MLRNMLKNADKIIDRVRLVEKNFDTIEPTPKLELILSSAMLEWSQGCNFEDLPQYADLADGDFVRSFRLVVDLLRQIRRATVERPSLGDKLSRSIDKINRDVVDAERQLRIEQ
jgi:superfamily II RNA helicase